jgi:hypothetical protein
MSKTSKRKKKTLMELMMQRSKEKDFLLKVRKIKKAMRPSPDKMFMPIGQ